jgi:uncharacterized membrane protein
MITILSIPVRIDNVVDGQRVGALAENDHRGVEAPL